MIHLLYAGNTRVFDGLFLSALSVAAHTSAPLFVSVLTMDYTEKDARFTPITPAQCAYLERRLQRENPESRVNLLDVGDLYRQYLAGNPNEAVSYTPYTLLRLLADRIPALPERVIYLDTDTLARGDIRTLWEYDLGGCEIGAVRDNYGCHFFGINYINAGVLLLDLARIRETGMLSRALARCAEKKLFLSDQNAINRETRRKRILPRRFNEQQRIRPDTLIRHFSMTIHLFPRPHKRNIKPWDVTRVREELGIHEFDPLLDEYLAALPDIRRLAESQNA